MATVLMAALVIVLAVSVGLAADSIAESISEPSGPTALQVTDTDFGIEMTVEASKSNETIRVTRNGRRLDRINSTAGTTHTYYGSQGDTFKFISIDKSNTSSTVLRTHTITTSTSFIGVLSLDERSLSSGSVRFDGGSHDIEITGDVEKVDGKVGDAIRLSYRTNETASGIRIRDLREFKSYTITFLIRSDGDTDDTDNAADHHYFETTLLGWENGHSLVTYGALHNYQIFLGTDRGFNPFATIKTDEHYSDADDWHFVSITREAGSNAVACVDSPSRDESCQTIQFHVPQDGVSDFVIGTSKFSGEIDEVLVFDEAMTAEEIDDIQRRYADAG